MKKICSLLSLWLILISSLEARIIYISAYATGTSDGTSWETAYKNYSEVYGVSKAGDTIVFAAGLYPVSAGSRNASMKIKEGVKVFGGFAGNEVINALSIETRNFYSHQTILHGDVKGDDYTTGNIKDNVSHVVEFDATRSNITSDTRLDGFILIGGNSGDGGDGTPISGGGIYMIAGGDYYGTYVCNPVLANLRIMGNRAFRHGGGAFLYSTKGTCSPTFLNCEFSGNYAGSAGGAVSIISNQGECSPVFDNCVFENNSIGTGFPSVGSAVFVEVNGYPGSIAKANPVFNMTSFCNNVGKLKSAVAIYAGSTSSIPMGTNYCSVQILNSTFVNNGNYAVMLKKYDYVESFDALIANSILWGGNTISKYQVTPLIHHSIIQGSGASGAGWSTSLGTDGGGNIDSDPLLANPMECDFRLLSGSPALDTGIDSIGHNIGFYQGSGLTSAASIYTSGFKWLFGERDLNATSSEFSYKVAARNLTKALEIRVPEGFSITGTSGVYSGDTTVLTLSPTGGMVDTTEVYVRFTPSEQKVYYGNITHSSQDAITKLISVSGKGVILPPTIVFPSNVSFDEVEVGEKSIIKGYSLTGSKLTSDVGIKLTGPFSMSLDLGGLSNKYQELVIPQENGMIDTIVYFQFIPESEGFFAGSIRIGAEGADSVITAISGTGIIPPPALEVSPLSLDMGEVKLGESSLPKALILNGNHLISDVNLGSQGEIYIGTNSSGDNKMRELTFSPSEGEIETAEVYVYYVPSDVPSQLKDSIYIATEGIDTIWVHLTGESVVVFSPELSISEVSMEFDTLIIGGPVSNSYNFRINGLNLDALVKVIPPTGVKVWENDISGNAVTSPDTLFFPSGNISIPYNLVDKLIWVSLAPKQTGSFEDSIKIITAGIDAKYLVIKGFLKDDNTPVELTSKPVLSIYPNPFKDGFKIVSDEDILKVMIIDVTGTSKAAFYNTDVMDLANLRSGLYFVKIETRNGIIVKQVVKK